MHRDIEPEPLSRQASPSAGQSVIAVIGIDRYAAWPRLENAVSDAKGASRLFEQLGFAEATAPLLDEAATGEAMRRLVTDDLGKLSTDDSLVLFFAGHGYTHTADFGDMSVKTGCVIPVDASPPRGHVSSSWLRLDSWLSDIARLPPRHILVIIDACYSGISLGALHKWREEGPLPTAELAALQARRSRRIITSALDDQRALDGGPYPGHSLFTGCLIEALSGGLARGGQRVATGRELGQYLQKRVRSYPPSTQTPDFGTFELDDRGDIVVPISFKEVPGHAPIAFEDAALTVPSTTAEQITMDSRPRSRTGLWVTASLVASALVAGIVFVARDDGTSRSGAVPVAAGDAGASAFATPAPAPTEPATTVVAPDATVAETTLPAAETDPLDAELSEAAPATPPVRITHGSQKTVPSITRSRDRSRKLPTPIGTLTAPMPAVTPPPPTTPPATPTDPSQEPTNTSPVHSTPESVLSAVKCSKATFAAVYEAEAPDPSTVRSALRELKACRDTGEISNADFDRYQTALVAKL